MIVQQSVQLFVEPKDESDVVTLLRTAQAALVIDEPVIEGLSRTYDIAVYDVKCCGESVTHPHLRIMTFRSEHYGKLVRGFVRSLLPEANNIISKENFPPSALVMTLDGGKHQGAKQQTHIHIHTDRKTLTQTETYNHQNKTYNRHS